MSDPGEYGDAPEIAEEIMAGFRRTTRGVSARFSSGQAGIIRNLVAQVAELVGGAGAAEPPAAGAPAEPGEAPGAELPVDLAAILAMDGPAAPPEDPVLARLFPDAYGDDPEAAIQARAPPPLVRRKGSIRAFGLG